MPNERGTHPDKIEGLEPHDHFASFFQAEALRGLKRQSPLGGDPRFVDHPLIGRGFDTFSNAIHASSIDLLRECPRKFLYVERFHLGLDGKAREALFIGSITHSMLEKLVQGQDFTRAAEAVASTVSATCDSLMDKASPRGILPWGEGVNSAINAIGKASGVGMAIARYMFTRNPVPKGWRVVMTEVPVEFKWDTLTSPIRGTIDLLLYDPENNDLWIIDYKTSSFPLLQVASSYPLAVQPKVYRLQGEALRKAGRFTEFGIPEDATLKGICHILIKKPTIRQKKMQTFEEYCERVTEWYGINDTKENPHYLRSWVTFSGPVMSGELLIRLREADAAQRAFPDLDRFYANDKACFNYNSVCPFHALCTTNPVAWDDLLELRYAVAHRDDVAPPVQISVPFGSRDFQSNEESDSEADHADLS